MLDDEGRLHHEQPLDLETGERQALDEQLARLRRNVEDPGALLGGVPIWIVNSQAGLSRTSYGGVVAMTDRRAASCGPVVINPAAYAAVAMVLAGISRKNSRRVNRA